MSTKGGKREAEDAEDSTSGKKRRVTPKPGAKGRKQAPPDGALIGALTTTTSTIPKLKILFWNIKNFQPPDHQASYARESDTNGRVGFMYDYITGHSVDLAFIMESGFLNIVDLFGSSIFVAEDGTEYKVLQSEQMDHESYLLIAKMDQLQNLVPIHTDKLGFAIPKLIGDPVTIWMTKKKGQKVQKMVARQAGMISYNNGAFTADMAVLHAPSPDWQNKAGVITETVRAIKKEGKSKLKFIFGDLNHRRTEWQALHTAFQSFYYLGPHKENVALATSIRQVMTIQKSDTVEEAMSEPYDQVWCNEEPPKGSVSVYIDSSLQHLTGEFEESVITNMDDYRRMATRLLAVNSEKKLVNLKTELKERVKDIDKILQGGLFYSKKERDFRKSNPMADEEEELILDNVVKNCALILGQTAKADTADPELEHFIDQLLGTLGNPPSRERYNSISYSTLPSKLKTLAKLYENKALVGSEQKFLGAYSFLISDHLPVHFDITLPTPAAGDSGQAQSSSELPSNDELPTQSELSSSSKPSGSSALSAVVREPGGGKRSDKSKKGKLSTDAALVETLAMKTPPINKGDTKVKKETKKNISKGKS